MRFAERLKTERLKKGLKQRELAEKIKSTNTSVSNWEHGLSQPSASVVKLLAEALEVSPFALLGDYTLRKVQELENDSSAVLCYEDTLAIEFSKDIVREISVQTSDGIDILTEDMDKDLKEIGKAIQTGITEKLLGRGGEQFLYSYHCLNSKGKILLLDYLTGLLRLPDYVDENEAASALDKEQIEELLRLRETLKGELENGQHT